MVKEIKYKNILGQEKLPVLKQTIKVDHDGSIKGGVNAIKNLRDWNFFIRLNEVFVYCWDNDFNDGVLYSIVSECECDQCPN